jgi:hypothetical protein
MSISRRKLLKSKVTAASIAFVSYTGERVKASSGDDSAATEDSHDMPTEIKLAMEPVSLSQSERESIDPIVFSERPEPEQQKLQTAIETGRFIDQIGNESQATRNIREAYQDTLEEQVV